MRVYMYSVDRAHATGWHVYYPLTTITTQTTNTPKQPQYPPLGPLRGAARRDRAVHPQDRRHAQQPRYGAFFLLFYMFMYIRMRVFFLFFLKKHVYVCTHALVCDLYAIFLLWMWMYCPSLPTPWSMRVFSPFFEVCSCVCPFFQLSTHIDPPPLLHFDNTTHHDPPVSIYSTHRYTNTNKTVYINVLNTPIYLPIHNQPRLSHPLPRGQGRAGGGLRGDPPDGPFLGA